MGLFGGLFSRGTEDERLEEQRKKLNSVHELVKDASDEIGVIKDQLVRKANGSLYPGLHAGSKSGVSSKSG